MRNLLALAATVLLSFAAVGWYLDWYKIKSTPASEGRRQVTIDINSPKIGQDLNKAKAKLRDGLENQGKDINPQQVEKVVTQTLPVPSPNWTAPAGKAAQTPPRPNASDDGFFVLPGVGEVSLPHSDSGPSFFPQR